MFRIKATFLENGFYGGCGIAREKYAFKYSDLAKLPQKIKWGCLEAELSDIDPRNGSFGVYKTFGRVVAVVAFKQTVYKDSNENRFTDKADAEKSQFILDYDKASAHGIRSLIAEDNMTRVCPNDLCKWLRKNKEVVLRLLED